MNELYHHGVKGQKWGVTNGPPYPLSDDISTGKSLRKMSREEKRAEKKASTKSELTKKAKTMSEEDLKKEIDRLNLEKRYVDLNKDLTRKEKTETFLSKYGTQILTTAVSIASAYAVNKLINETVDVAIDKRKAEKYEKEFNKKRQGLKMYTTEELKEITNRRKYEEMYLNPNNGGKSKKKR